MSGSNVPIGPDGLMPLAPTSRPFNARAIGDLGPGQLAGGQQAAAGAILTGAMSSPDPAVQALGALGGSGRTRNCKGVVASFSAPSTNPAPAGLYAYRQQVLPQNPNRKLLLIGSPWSHGDPAQPVPVYVFPGNGGTGFVVLFQSGPQALTQINSLSELNGYLPQALFTAQGGTYAPQNIELPPTDPVTVVVWQFKPAAGGFVLDVNVSILEGS